MNQIGEILTTEYRSEGTYLQVRLTPSAKDGELLQRLHRYEV